MEVKELIGAIAERMESFNQILRELDSERERCTTRRKEDEDPVFRVLEELICDPRLHETISRRREQEPDESASLMLDGLMSNVHEVISRWLKGEGLESSAHLLLFGLVMAAVRRHQRREELHESILWLMEKWFLRPPWQGARSMELESEPNSAMLSAFAKEFDSFKSQHPDFGLIMCYGPVRDDCEQLEPYLRELATNRIGNDDFEDERFRYQYFDDGTLRHYARFLPTHELVVYVYGNPSAWKQFGDLCSDSYLHLVRSLCELVDLEGSQLEIATVHRDNWLWILADPGEYELPEFGVIESRPFPDTKSFRFDVHPALASKALCDHVLSKQAEQATKKVVTEVRGGAVARESTDGGKPAYLQLLQGCKDIQTDVNKAIPAMVKAAGLVDSLQPHQAAPVGGWLPAFVSGRLRSGPVERQASMRLVTAWQSFKKIVRDAQDAVDILHGYFQQQGSNVGQQTRALDRNDKKELLALLANLESSLSEQITSEILQGLRKLSPSVNVVGEERGAYRYSDIGPCLDRLRDVVRGFADDLMRDAADGSLESRVCSRYLRLCEVVGTLTLLEDGLSTSRTLEQALAHQTPEAASGDCNATAKRAERDSPSLAKRLYRERYHMAEAAFRLERWLNPCCFPWGDDPERPDPKFNTRSRSGSPIAVIGVLDQVRGTLDDLYRICGWQAFCGRPESYERPRYLPPTTSWTVMTEVGYDSLVGLGDTDIPETIADDLTYHATQLEIELEDSPPPTPNQIPAEEIREAMKLVSLLAGRIRRHRRERERIDKPPTAGGPVKNNEGEQAKPTGGGEATRKEPSKDNYPTPDNFERDKWLYEQKKRGVVVPRLVLELLNEFYVNELAWESMEESGIRAAIHRYCDHVGLIFPAGRSGRPKERVEPQRPPENPSNPH